MEEELNYVTPTFKRDGARAREEASSVIYDQVLVNIGRENTITPENPSEKREGGHLQPLLCVLAAALGIVCVILVSVIIMLSNRIGAVKSEQEGEIKNFTTQVLQLGRKTEEIARDRDQLNWTLGVILQYDVFLVNVHCPQRVCKPCEYGWIRFKSNCYLFEESTYYYNWRSWEGSRKKCNEMTADLVMIESLEEQEFINNYTKGYNDDAHGYWIGLSNNNINGTWMWINGSNFTVEYWQTQQPGYKVSCALTLPKAKPLANWGKAACDMRNRWICKKKALIKFD
ncbi:CD209 antigen-like protein 2 isoform X1 [Takifugu rubripes]|uniref:CD209 antigen-like protein 2 isoform X1 n=1 Tax=Takifugu rubripes TaxID=31033 RepID=UPI0005D21B52|nr:CD209 antigen-like protein 2 isoform X1 [Takifugu rubripes]|eukprot:XP_003965756.2 PREDICTED: CD209 antigen-like protein 2 isoform X1 [Takifugu rubripes]